MKRYVAFILAAAIFLPINSMERSAQNSRRSLAQSLQTNSADSSSRSSGDLPEPDDNLIERERVFEPGGDTITRKPSKKKQRLLHDRPYKLYLHNRIISSRQEETDLPFDPSTYEYLSSGNEQSVTQGNFTVAMNNHYLTITNDKTRKGRVLVFPHEDTNQCPVTLSPKARFAISRGGHYILVQAHGKVICFDTQFGRPIYVLRDNAHHVVDMAIDKKGITLCTNDPDTGFRRETMSLNFKLRHEIKQFFRSKKLKTQVTPEQIALFDLLDRSITSQKKARLSEDQAVTFCALFNKYPQIREHLAKWIANKNVLEQGPTLPN